MMVLVLVSCGSSFFWPCAHNLKRKLPLPGSFFFITLQFDARNIWAMSHENFTLPSGQDKCHRKTKNRNENEASSGRWSCYVGFVSLYMHLYISAYSSSLLRKSLIISMLDIWQIASLYLGALRTSFLRDLWLYIWRFMHDFSLYCKGDLFIIMWTYVLVLFGITFFSHFRFHAQDRLAKIMRLRTLVFGFHLAYLAHLLTAASLWTRRPATYPILVMYAQLDRANSLAKVVGVV